MHIGFVTSEYPDCSNLKLKASGGIGTFIRSLALKLVSKGCKVTVFVCVSQKENEQILEDGDIDVRTVPVLSKNFIWSRILIYLYFLKQKNIDVLEFPDWEGLHAFCFLKIPIVTRLHGSVTYFNYLQGIKRSVVMFLFEKMALCNSKKIIAVSDYVNNLTRELFKTNVNIETIYNSIDVVKFSGNGVFNNKILYFGTLVEKKGVYDLPDIFNNVISILDSAELYIVGKDTINTKTNESVWKEISSTFSSKAKEYVKYLGPLKQDDLIEIIKSCTFCVFPSKAETFGLVTIEAMSMSKIVITYDLPWNNELVVNNKSGFCVSNVNEFSENIIQVAQDKQRALEIMKNAKQHVKLKFNVDKIVNENILMYKRILNE